MARHVFTHDECVKGGNKRKETADYSAMGKAGFARTCETHPFMARKWLKYAPGMRRYGMCRPFYPHPRQMRLNWNVR